MVVPILETEADRLDVDEICPQTRGYQKSKKNSVERMPYLFIIPPFNY
jgi:hypothetical protein